MSIRIRSGRGRRPLVPVLAVLCAVAALTTQATDVPAVRAAAANGTQWTHADEGSFLSSTAETQTPEECDGVIGILDGTSPGWVRVGGSTSPSTPFVRADGQVLVEDSDDYFSQQSVIAHFDIPPNHFSHDLITFLVPDPQSRYLLADGNFVEGEDNEHAKMEIEWERAGVPTWAYPANGDRLTVWGPHIFDCGHGDGWVSGDTYRTEIHPPVGWVVYRQTADADGLPGSESKRTRSPWKWYDNDDLQGIGERLPSTGLLNTPAPSTVADAFFSSYGGDAPEALNGCDTLEIGSCMQENEWRQNLLQQDYTFFVPSPPKPTAQAGDPAGEPTLVWEAEDRCSAVPTSPANPPGEDADDVGEADYAFPTADGIGAPTCGGIPTTVHVATDTYGRPGINVTVRASEADYPANGYIAFAKRYRLAWDVVPAVPDTRSFTVSFDTLRVWDDSEPCVEDGEWLLSLRVNEKWIYPVRGHGDNDEPFWSFGAVNDGLCDFGYGNDYQDYSIGESLDVLVRPGQPINVWSRGFESDASEYFNDLIPVINDFRDGAGSFHTRHGIGGDADYELFYTITENATAPPTQGTLSIGDPTYGPNADTGGTARRISGASVLELTGSDASALQYRFWPQGDAAPAGWLYDTVGPLRIDLPGSGAADGRYVVQYAPVSAAGIVGTRRASVLELDTATPTLVVPANLTVDATSAAGATVTYSTTATDNLPGPVTSSCDKPSGTFFPIRTVTTVTCTASDAVANQVTKVFTVEVVSPFGYLPDFVVLSEKWTRLGSNVVVTSGNIGAFTSSSGPAEAPGYEVKIGNGSRLLGVSQIAAETVQLGSGVLAHDVFNVNGISAGTGSTYTARRGYVPLFLGLPTVPTFTAGTSDITVSTVATVVPGHYGMLRIKPGAVVTLAGGVYDFSGIDLGSKGQLLAAAASTVRVTGRLVAGSNAVVRPTAPQLASALRIYVRGTDAPTLNQHAASFGTDSTVIGNLYVPAGTLQFGQHSLARGGFLGRQVDVGNDAQLIRESAFDYP